MAAYLIVDEFLFPRDDVVVDVVGVAPRIVKKGERLVNELLDDGLVHVELILVERVAFGHTGRVEYVILRHTHTQRMGCGQRHSSIFGCGCCGGSAKITSPFCGCNST